MSFTNPNINPILTIIIPTNFQSIFFVFIYDTLQKFIKIDRMADSFIYISQKNLSDVSKKLKCNPKNPDCAKKIKAGEAIAKKSTWKVVIIIAMIGVSGGLAYYFLAGGGGLTNPILIVSVKNGGGLIINNNGTLGETDEYNGTISVSLIKSELFLSELSSWAESLEEWNLNETGDSMTENFPNSTLDTIDKILITLNYTENGYVTNDVEITDDLQGEYIVFSYGLSWEGGDLFDDNSTMLLGFDEEVNYTVDANEYEYTSLSSLVLVLSILGMEGYSSSNDTENGMIAGEIGEFFETFEFGDPQNQIDLTQDCTLTIGDFIKNNTPDIEDDATYELHIEINEEEYMIENYLF